MNVHSGTCPAHLRTPPPRPPRRYLPRCGLSAAARAARAALAALGTLGQLGTLGTALCMLPGTAHAQLVISDNFTGASSSFNWSALNGACLTAGNGTGSIPACVGLAYYTSRGSVLVGGVSGRLPDPAGSGALRLTNGDFQGGGNGDNQTGAIVSNFTFPTNLGLRVTFVTVTYGGDGFNGTGADGITFFLSDGSRPPTVGGLGGSLGYSCSNVNGVFDGVSGGYIGLGIDEFGNFSNPSDNTDTGPGFRANRITLRGAGDTNWASLSSRFPHYYPASADESTRRNAVRNTCKTGNLWNYSGAARLDANNNLVNNGAATSERLPFNYPAITWRDLDTSIANQQAVWMPLRGNAIPIVYDLRITGDGLLDLAYSVNGGAPQTLIAQQRITESNGPLPSSFRFGFSSGTGGGNNVHEITCFKAEPATMGDASAGSNLQRTGQLLEGTQAYFAYYNPVNAWGQLTAYGLLGDADGNVALAPNASWDGHCKLTGGVCNAMGGTVVAVQGPSQRNILTWNGSAGIPLQWADLSTAQRDALTRGDASATANRLNYLRGDRSGEVGQGGQFRSRTGVLGDIIESSPTWVGPPAAAYPQTFVDLLHGTTGPETAYSSFRSARLQRPHVVYVGANDGMLHGFRAGASSASGTNDLTAANDGHELLAYMPGRVVETIQSTSAEMSFSSPQYLKNTYVNATPGVGDLFVNGSWRTWLVGTLGNGGNASGPVNNGSDTAFGTLYALDITNPANFSEANAASIVLGEWNSSTLTCGATACGQHLGSVTGAPQIRRLHNGNWAAILGNGLNSSSGTAGIYIMLISTNGSISFRFLDTGVTGTGTKNGIAAVTPADLDGDRITDYVYAGDVLGNVWRFDLTSSNPANWGSPVRIFNTPNGQPITTRVAVVAVPDNIKKAASRVMVAFGTGQRLAHTGTQAGSYAPGTQTLYGVWDWNLEGWNSLAASSGRTYLSLTAPQTVAATDLLTQSVSATTAATATTVSLRTVTRLTVCWRGNAGCLNGGHMGWQMALPGSSEQVIYDPQVISGLFVVNTTIPAASGPLSCGVRPPTGYTMVIGVGSGGAPPSSVFSSTNNAVFDLLNGEVVAGAGLDATGMMTVVRAQSQPSFVYQKSDGSQGVRRVSFSGMVATRMTWRKIR